MQISLTVSFRSSVSYMTSIQYTVNIHKGLDPLNTGTMRIAIGLLYIKTYLVFVFILAVLKF